MLVLPLDAGKFIAEECSDIRLAGPVDVHSVTRQSKTPELIPD
jgi:hypothetical protein